jgi:hypothetical protein
VSQDLELLADSVDLRITQNQLNRVMAWGKKSRARAVSPERLVTADSIDAQLPNQRLRIVNAVGKAYANSVPDTSKIISTERDWMKGDVVVAEFDSIAPTDTTSKPQPKKLVATGNAASYYQLAGSGSAAGKTQPNINYVRGRVITVTFANRAVDKVDVVDKATGVYLEPEQAGPATKTANGTPTIKKQSP